MRDVFTVRSLVILLPSASLRILFWSHFFYFFSIKLVGCGCCCPPGWNWTAPELTTPPLTHTHTLGWFESIDVWLVSRVSLLQSSSLMLSQCHLVLFLSLFLFLPVILLFSLRHHSSAPVKKKKHFKWILDDFLSHFSSRLNMWVDALCFKSTHEFSLWVHVISVISAAIQNLLLIFYQMLSNFHQRLKARLLYFSSDLSSDEVEKHFSRPFLCLLWLTGFHYTPQRSVTTLL